MKFKRYQLLILFRVALLMLCVTGFAFLILKGFHLYAGISFLLIAFLVFELLKFINNNNEELERFVESVHYRDFSRHFDVKNAPTTVKDLRKGFNEINSTFKLISREKETQYQYLQKILEMVDTGILSYELNTGEIFWLNESFKKMLNIPYLKTIHSLEKRESSLYHEIIQLKNGEQKVVKANNENNSFKILIAATAFQTDGKTYKLIAFQNVNEALDENESEAWKKLLSVMTHEIMNSIAPISSLADTLKNRLQRSGKDVLSNQNDVEDLAIGIETIQRRSEGLLKFAETYRTLNKITTLNLKKIYARDLFENIQRLMQPSIDEKNIEFEIILPQTDLSFMGDQSLIEQVLINLVVNAIDAVKDKPGKKIYLAANHAANNKVIIRVSDNGAGIPQELLEKIFIPFFSTRKNGSGIGLSLCKQILMLHKGNIQVQSVEGKGSSFLLSL